jgi:hypothetical protein
MVIRFWPLHQRESGDEAVHLGRKCDLPHAQLIKPRQDGYPMSQGGELRRLGDLLGYLIQVKDRCAKDMDYLNLQKKF